MERRANQLTLFDLEPEEFYRKSRSLYRMARKYAEDQRLGGCHIAESMDSRYNHPPLGAYLHGETRSCGKNGCCIDLCSETTIINRYVLSCCESWKTFIAMPNPCSEADGWYNLPDTFEGFRAGVFYSAAIRCLTRYISSLRWPLVWAGSTPAFIAPPSLRRLVANRVSAITTAVGNQGVALYQRMALLDTVMPELYSYAKAFRTVACQCKDKCRPGYDSYTVPLDDCVPHYRCNRHGRKKIFGRSRICENARITSCGSGLQISYKSDWFVDSSKNIDRYNTNRYSPPDVCVLSTNITDSGCNICAHEECADNACMKGMCPGCICSICCKPDCDGLCVSLTKDQLDNAPSVFENNYALREIRPGVFGTPSK